MKTFSNSERISGLTLALCAAFSNTVWAQNAPTPQATQLKPVVVTAARTDTRADELVSEVVVIDRASIESNAGRTLTELLSRQAGLQLTSNGGLGKYSSAFVRGTESRHTILLVDGVRVGSATTGAPSWDNIPLDMVDRIEVLKGPASALYGSEAVGGVVQVFLRKGVKGLQPSASLTLGSHSHVQADASLRGGDGALSYAIGVQRAQDKGFSATNSKAAFGNYNADKDGFKQNALNASVSYQISPNWNMDAGLLYSDSVNHYDDTLAGDTRAAVRNQTLHAGVAGKVMPSWTASLRVSRSNDRSRDIESAYMPSAFDTQQDQITWQNNVDTPLGVAMFGAERLTQKVDGSTAYDVSQRHVNSVFAGVNGAANGHSWQANVRRDSNSQFGDSNTWLLGYGYAINPAWRVNASYGTSFVAPSFNQLYYPGFGNTTLLPEKGKNLDLGVSYSANGHSVKLIHFDNKIQGFISNSTQAANIPRARIDGWTLGYTGQFGPVSLHANVDALNPRNELTGQQLARRAKTQVSLGAEYAMGAWLLGGHVLSVGKRYDDAKNTLVLNSYTTVDLFANYAFNKDVSAQMKMNNVTNKSYETSYGFNQPGRTAYLSLRYTLK
ncbi:MAG TPA: TonB-dependent receptor [Burkholderiaceae bacterium]|nr:TonB-dependent receptor [Burkholderiaceae bacterium]